MKLNDVLLGLVKLYPGVSGYELRKIISLSTQYFVKAQLSQIYPALKQMTSDGLMSFEEVVENGRLIKRYVLTQQGNDHLLARLREPIDFSLSMSNQRLLMLRLTFIGFLPKEEQIDFVRNALDYFTYERDELMKGHLEVEDDYLDEGLGERNDVMRMWGWEIRYIFDTEDRLIQWLGEILTDLES